MPRSKKSMDGNTAAAPCSLCVYRSCRHLPHHPVEPHGRPGGPVVRLHQKNIFGTEVKVVEMQSEAGAAGTVHGSLLPAR